MKRIGFSFILLIFLIGCVEQKKFNMSYEIQKNEPVKFYSVKKLKEKNVQVVQTVCSFTKLFDSNIDVLIRNKKIIANDVERKYLKKLGDEYKLLTRGMLRKLKQVAGYEIRKRFDKADDIYEYQTMHKKINFMEDDIFNIFGAKIKIIPGENNSLKCKILNN